MPLPEQNYKSKLRIFVDSDGFPNTELSIEIARRHGIEIVIAGNFTQNLDRFESIEGIEIIEVSDGMDVADFAIINAIKKGDILLTGDTGLAAIALGKGAKVLNSRGHEYREETIDQRLMARHISKKIRRGGGRTKGPKKMNDKDRVRFTEKLNKMINL